MTQEEHILCEIEEFKIELQRSIDRTRRLERFIREKETELYYCRMKSGTHSLFHTLQDAGFSSNCNKICEIVKNWMPPELDGNDVYSDAWNDYREEILRNLK
jgi:hypothetical protein